MKLRLADPGESGVRVIHVAITNSDRFQPSQGAMRVTGTIATTNRPCEAEMWPSTSTGVPMRKVAVTFTFLLCTGVAAETLQPLTGWADDSNGHLVWTSSSTRSSSQPSWMIRHTVENKAPDGNLRVVWEPDIYDGWVPHGAERGSGGTDGPETPQAQIGSITYGKSGKKSASSYRPASEKTPPASIATDHQRQI